MFEHLLAPGKMGGMQFRSHILMGSTETHFTCVDGCMTRKEIDFYVNRPPSSAAFITTHQVQNNTKRDPIDSYPRSARQILFIPSTSSEIRKEYHYG